MMSSARSASNQGNFTSEAIIETVHSSRIAQFHNISADDNYLSHELMSNKSQWILFGMPLEITFYESQPFHWFCGKMLVLLYCSRVLHDVAAWQEKMKQAFGIVTLETSSHLILFVLFMLFFLRLSFSLILCIIHEQSPSPSASSVKLLVIIHYFSYG